MAWLKETLIATDRSSFFRAYLLSLCPPFLPPRVLFRACFVDGSRATVLPLEGRSSPINSVEREGSAVCSRVYAPRTTKFARSEPRVNLPHLLPPFRPGFPRVLDRPGPITAMSVRARGPPGIRWLVECQRHARESGFIFNGRMNED